ncbi:DUF4241 domain-containing protein [Spirillospora sp. NPDC077959]|uniref:DUF4241 domain-containing protein n=1 Tax=Spirillospora sp. NPDC077959 TaxID=3364529 RepID=UPI0037D523AD
MIDVQSAGALRLPTGHLIVQDPGWGVQPEVQPFIVKVPPGRYPVTLSISHWERSPVPQRPSPMRLVNAARLNIRAESAVSWELALQPGQDAELLEDGSFFGFSVDSGAGCFLDASARDHLELDRPAMSNAIYRTIQVGGIEVPTDDPDLNVIVFRCGMGDGTYPTWIGRARNGEVACFVADFELLQHSLGTL